MFFKCPEGYLFDSELEPEPDCAPADQVKSCNDVVIPKPTPKKEFEIRSFTLSKGFIGRTNYACNFGCDRDQICLQS